MSSKTEKIDEHKSKRRKLSIKRVVPYNLKQNKNKEVTFKNKITFFYQPTKMSLFYFIYLT